MAGALSLEEGVPETWIWLWDPDKLDEGAGVLYVRQYRGTEGCYLTGEWCGQVSNLGTRRAARRKWDRRPRRRHPIETQQTCSYLQLLVYLDFIAPVERLLTLRQIPRNLLFHSIGGPIAFFFKACVRFLAFVSPSCFLPTTTPLLGLTSSGARKSLICFLPRFPLFCHHIPQGKTGRYIYLNLKPKNP